MRDRYLLRTLVAAGIGIVLPGIGTHTLIGQGRAAVKVASAAPTVPVWNPHFPKLAPPPRNADGHPDLTGVWDYKMGTPVQRRPEYGDTLFLDAREATAYGKTIAEARDTDKRSEDIANDAYNRGMNNAWFDNDGPLGQGRTSLIVDPPNGRLPPLTAAAQAQMARSPTNRSVIGMARRDMVHEELKRDTVQDRNLSERCLVQNGPPIIPTSWNNNLHIFHTKDVVVIHTEMIHTARVVWLDGRTRADSSVKQWHGISRGRWDGDTLVIETTNFRPDAVWLGVLHPEHFTLVERLTRIDADTVLYESTTNDPETYTRPWTVQVPMRRLQGYMYEYACNEGNYGLKFQLTAARAEEKAEAAAKSTGAQ